MEILHSRFHLIGVACIVIKVTMVLFIYFFLIFQVQPYNRKYRSIGHCVWSMSLDILTELSVNLFNSAEPSAQSMIVMQF